MVGNEDLIRVFRGELCKSIVNELLCHRITELTNQAGNIYGVTYNGVANKSWFDPRHDMAGVAADEYIKRRGKNHAK